MSDELILISISGNDRPGLTASITEILGRYNAVIMDIGQADIHHTLSLGILFRVNGSESGNILKEILFKSSELGVHVRFKPVSPEEYENWVKRQGKGRFIITMLGRVITASQLSKVTSVIYQQNLNIDNMKRLTGRPPLDVQDIDSLRSCVEISVRGDLSDRNALSTSLMELSAKEGIDISFQTDDMYRRTRRLICFLSTSLMELSAKEGIDISFQTDDMYRRTRRLICFDMDSTLIKTEVIDELADRAGVGPQVRAVTESAMRGEIDFVESFTRRVALLKGLDVSVMDEIADNLPIMDGADKLMGVLKKCGFKIAILSGGFTYFGERLRKRFGVDYVYANELEIEDGKLTGRFAGDVVDGKRKAELLRLIAQVEKIELQQTVAVGDGANDLPMLNLAGLGIAFHAKPKVKANAKQSISTVGLDGILYLLGFRDVQINS